MILAFTLSMPNCASWDGKWSGEGKKYVVTRTFNGKAGIAKAEAIRDKGYYHYSWPDGWGAGISVKEVDSRQAAKLRKESQGFCGYDWMVKSIVAYGRPMADHEVKEFLKKNALPIVKAEGICAFEGCEAPAKFIACGRDSYSKEVLSHSVPACYCDAHMRQVADESNPEYSVECPNCGCCFGVN